MHIACVASRACRLRRPPYASVDFDSCAGYLKSLSRATRRDMRRKLKCRERDACRVARQHRRHPRRRHAPVPPRPAHMRRSRFEELTPELFPRRAARTAPARRCATYWIGDRLVAFNLVLQTRTAPDRQVSRHGLRRTRAATIYTFIPGWRTCAIASTHGIPAVSKRPGPASREASGLAAACARTGCGTGIATALIDSVFAAFERLFRLDRLRSRSTALLPDPRRHEPPFARHARRPMARLVALLACEMLRR